MCDRFALPADRLMCLNHHTHCWDCYLSFPGFSNPLEIDNKTCNIGEARVISRAHRCVYTKTVGSARLMHHWTQLAASKYFSRYVDWEWLKRKVCKQSCHEANTANCGWTARWVHAATQMGAAQTSAEGNSHQHSR